MRHPPQTRDVVVLLSALTATASVTALLAFNFFFLPPVGALTIADPQNWIALAAFVIVAMIASHLSAAAQARAREAIWGPHAADQPEHLRVLVGTLRKKIEPPNRADFECR
ncbi:MAG TPA: DUF4118 domain-containing protein [Vicinamibacterales bacterium]|nr:DUF4118 domain-containing protein [Vicinamibacterales bacterium]